MLLIKDDYEERIFDLNKQMEMLDVKRRTEEDFTQTLIHERGLEREEYEAKIKELTQALKKSNALQENEETIISRVSLFLSLFGVHFVCLILSFLPL